MKSSLKLLAACIVFSVSVSLRCQQPADLSKLDMTTLEDRASQGDSAAQNELGDRYNNGKGVPHDFGKSFEWYRRGAEQGNVAAEFKLFLAYENGWGVDADKTQAINWLKKSADGGYALAQFNLARKLEKGIGVPTDLPLALALYQKAADQGIAWAQVQLGMMYLTGKGTAQNNTEACRWFRKAADQQDNEAEDLLGLCYLYGRGVTKDYSEALAWFHRSDAHGAYGATENIADMYMKGLGVTQSYQKARAWYQKAASMGDPDAPKLLAQLDAIQRTEAAQEQAEQQQAAKERTKAIQRAQSGTTIQATSEHSDWQLKVDRLTREVQTAEQGAVDAEALAKKYANDSTNAASSGDIGGALVGALNVGVASRYKNEALQARRKADSLRAELDSLGAAEPAAPTEVSSSVQSIVSTPTAAPDNAIADELHRQRANINATGQRIAAQQAERQRQQEQTAAANRQRTPQGTQSASAQATSRPVPSYSTTRIVAAPPVPSDNSSSVTSQGPVLTVSCPSSGFVPGVMRRVSSDVSEGVSCTPGSAIYVNGIPQYDMTCTNAPTWPAGHPPTCPMNDYGAGAGGLAGLDPTLRKHVVSPGTLQQCVSMDFNGKTSMVGELGWDRYMDNCDVAINLTIIFANSPGPSAFDIEAGGFNGLSRSRSDYDRLGTAHKYACPKGYGAADLNGKYLTRPVAEYICREHGW